MSGVDLFPLGEVVAPTRPRVKPSDYPDLPFIGMEHVEAHSMKLLGTVPAATMKSSAVHFRPGDVLYGRLRPYLNKVYRPTFEGLCSAEFIVFPENDRVDGRYLQYFLNSSAFARYASHLNTGDRPRVDFDQLAPYEIPLPEVDEQRRIVAEIEKQFSRLDEAVANLQRSAANLFAYKQAAVREAIWGDRSAAPADGDLPAGWALAALTELGELGRGKSKHRPRDDPRLYGGPYPFIQTGDVRRSAGLIREYTQTYSEFGLQQSRLWPAGTLCITIAANIAETGILAMPACFPDSVVGFVSADETLVHYVELFFRTIRANLARFAPATAQKNINLSILERIQIPLPPASERERIVAEVARRLSIVREVETEAAANLLRAAVLRRAVMARAFSTAAV